jgi:AcrR family transcriptional regulator
MGLESAARTDRRPERTRQALLAAFTALVLENGYEMVTVDAVATRANIGRSTLYAHFGGLEGMLKQSLSGPSTALAVLVDRAGPSVGDLTTLTALLDHFREQRKRNKAFFTPPVRGLWVRRLAELIESRLITLAKSRRSSSPLLPWSFVALQIAEGQVALLTHWLALRPAIATETIAESLVAITRATLLGLAPEL